MQVLSFFKKIYFVGYLRAAVSIILHFGTMLATFSKYQVMEKFQRSVLRAYQNYSFQFCKSQARNQRRGECRGVGLPPPARLKYIQFAMNRKHGFFDSVL